MPRASKTLLVLVLAALLPLRAVAGVTIGFCANGHEAPPVASHAAHGDHAAHGAHAGHEHHSASAHEGGDGQPAKPATQTCSICAEHCASAAFAPGGAPQALAVPAAAQASPSDNARAAPPYYPDQLDRPPLA
jgi:hypothetical protein